MKAITLTAFLLALLALFTSVAQANDHKARDVEFEQLAEELAAKEPEGSPTNDSDDDLTAWEIGLISMTCFFFVLTLLMIVAIIVLGGKGGDKYQTNVHRNENIEGI